jgi:hypothetical protein
VTGLEARRLVRAGTHVISPRYWRWRRFLRQLTLDPDRLLPPVEEPTERDFIICGCPRSGTSLLSAMLHQPPRSVVVMEPWDGMRVPPMELFGSLREEIDRTDHLTRGKLDFQALSSDGDVRWRREGALPEAIRTMGGYMLGVKWPAFWRYLEFLPNTKFLVSLRHPAEVIGSFKRVGGRLSQGLEYDIAFNRKMNEELRRTRDVALRRVRFFDYVHERILPYLAHPNVLAVRYERWFSEPDQLLDEISQFLEVDLRDARALIREPEHRVSLNTNEVTLIQERCRTAAALGYATAAPVPGTN